MKKENLFFIILGFFLLAYLLDAVVNPLSLRLAIPYEYFTNKTLTTYPFTTVSIFLKAFGIFLLPLLLLSYLGISTFVKGIVTLILSALLQLYAVQDIASRSNVVPLEWSLGLTAAGVLLIIPTVIFLILGLLSGVHHNLLDDLPDDEPTSKSTGNKSSDDTHLHSLHPHEL